MKLEKLDIVGLPRLSFKRDEITQDYVNYMQAYVSNLSNERAGFEQALKSYYKPRDKKDAADAGDGEENGEAMVANFDLPCVGAWPLARVDGEYTKFGLPPLPLWLEFKPEFRPEMLTSFDNWLADIGGSNGIPELTKTCLRSFLVQVGACPVHLVSPRAASHSLARRTSARRRSRSGRRGPTSCATTGRRTRRSCCASTTATRRTR